MLFRSDDVENFEDGGEMRTMDTPETVLMTKQIAQTVNDTVASLPEELRTALHCARLKV